MKSAAAIAKTVTAAATMSRRRGCRARCCPAFAAGAPGADARGGVRRGRLERRGRPAGPAARARAAPPTARARAVGEQPPHRRKSASASIRRPALWRASMSWARGRSSGSAATSASSSGTTRGAGTHREIGFDPLFQRRDPKGFERIGVSPRARPQYLDVGEHRAPPERERLRENRRARVTRSPVWAAATRSTKRVASRSSSPTASRYPGERVTSCPRAPSAGCET